MSAWLDWVRDCVKPHDDAYLAERLARAVEDYAVTTATHPYRWPAVNAALRDYRARHPRQDA